VDPEGKFIKKNGAGCELAGYSPEEMREIPHSFLFDKASLPQIEDIFRRILSEVIADMENIVERLNQPAGMGVRIPIDNISTEFSSLNHLKRLLIRKLKIDKSFILKQGTSR